MSVDEDGAGLFELTPAAAGRTGAVERQLRAAIDAGKAAGRLDEQIDGPLAESAIVAARHLDVLGRLPTHKGAYAIAALLTPWRECLHALRLPTAFEVGDGPPLPAGGAPSGADSLRDLFGTPD